MTTAAQPPSDETLIAALRAGEPHAWTVFTTRYRGPLEAYARKNGIPRWEWPACIDEVLVDEALRLSDPTAIVPRSVLAYLLGAIRNKYLHLKRAAACRSRNHLAAAENFSGDWVVAPACSEASIRHSAGVDGATLDAPAVLIRLARDLRAELGHEERAMLDWVAEGISRRTIAGWLGINHDACAKRIWRLRRTLSRRALELRCHYSEEDRRILDRFLRRGHAAQRITVSARDRASVGRRPSARHPTSRRIRGARARSGRSDDGDAR